MGAQADISGWLEAVGFGAFAPLFVDNGIDFDLLGEITNEDLKDIGVTRLRDRKGVLRAIADLELATPQIATERRQLSTMFIDLVSSTVLAEKLDPEDFGDLIRMFRAACVAAVKAHGGYVANFYGDGILCLFGYPRAREDDAAEAVRGGQAVIESVAAQAQSPKILRLVPDGVSVRVAISSGVVVVGRLEAESAKRECTVVGETPYLAARLQSFAAPNAIVISDATRALLGARFELEDLGAKEIRGFPTAQQVWAVNGEITVESRFSARAGAAVSELIGREQEIETLRRVWDAARAGRGQALVVSGEAGIGKSRIGQLLKDAARADGAMVLRLNGSPFHESTPFHPLTERIAALAGIVEADDAETRRAKLAADLAGMAPLDAHLLAEALFLPLDDDPDAAKAAEALSPDARKTATLGALWRRIRNEAKTGPAAILIEDAHWIDPSTLDWIAFALAAMEDTPSLMMITHRPSVRLALEGAVTEMALKSLDADETRRLAAHVAGGRVFDEPLMEELVEKTDGVPLFVEEWARMLLARDALADATGAPKEEIPTTVHNLLLARIDQLGASKRILQLAACVGRIFTLGQLAALTSDPPEKLRAALADLVEGGLVFAVFDRPDAFLFKHALILDAAYGSLLQTKRALIHARFARAFEADLAETQPQVLAYHLDRGRLGEEAFVHWMAAAGRSMATRAFVEAIAYFRRAIDSAASLSGEAAQRLELEAQVQLAVPLTLTGGWASPEVAAAYGRASELCAAVGPSPFVFPALAGVFTYHLVSGQHLMAEALARRDLAAAEETGHAGTILEFEMNVGNVLHYTGRPREAEAHLQRVLELYDFDEHSGNALTYGKCPAAVTLSHQGRNFAVLGRADACFAANERALTTARATGHEFSEIWAKTNHALTLLIYQEYEAVERIAGEAITEAERRGFTPWLAQTQVYYGAARVNLGDVEGGLASIRAGMALWDMTGSQLMRPIYFVLLADCLFKAGRLEEAREAAETSISIAERTGEIWCRPWAEVAAVEIDMASGALEAPAAAARLQNIRAAAWRQGELLWALYAEKARLALRLEIGGRERDERMLRSLLNEFAAAQPYAVMKIGGATAAPTDPVKEVRHG